MTLNKILTQKLLILIVPSLILLLFISVHLINDTKHISTLKNENIKYSLIAKDLKLQVVQIQQWLTDISATRATPGFDDGFSEAKSQYDGAIANLDLYSKYYKNNPKMSKTIEDIKLKVSNFYNVGKVMAQAYIDGGPDAGNKLMANFDKAADELSKDINPFLEIQIETMTEKTNTIVDGISFMKNMAFIIFISTILLAFFTIKTILIAVLQPLNDTVDAITELS